MMGHVVVNDMGEREIRLSADRPAGAVLYSGHRLAVDERTLSSVLQYYFDRSRGTFLFLDYVKWDKVRAESAPSAPTAECLFADSAARGLARSYESLLDLASGRLGRLGKIHIYRHESDEV